MSTLYTVLGVNPDCTDKDITKAFRAKARVLHPDKQPPDASDADKLRACKAFQELVAAYEVLSDETKRKRYDLERSDTAAAPQPSSTPQQTQGRRDRPEQQHQRSSPHQNSQWQQRREQYEEEEEDDDIWSRSQAKTQAQEEDEKDERRRKAQEEKDKKYEGLGSHWVKPPPNMPKGGMSNFPGFHQPARQRAKPMPKTKSTKKKKRRRGGASDGDDSSDCDSDASSVLSFDIHINLKDYIFNLTEPAEFDTGAQNEVWTFEPKQPATAKPDVEASDDAKGRAKTVPMAKAGAKPCCSLQ